MPDDIMTREEVAQYARVSIGFLNNAASARTYGPPFVKLSRNAVRYRRADVDAWLASLLVRPEPQ